MRYSFPNINASRIFGGLVLALFVLSLSGCKQNMIYGRAVQDLNVKAQEALTQGDTAKAVSRLEAALDLVPDEPRTRYNLAVAYQQNKNWDKAVKLLEVLDKDQSGGESLQESQDVVLSLASAYQNLAESMLPEKPGQKLDAAKHAQIESLFQKALAAYDRVKLDKPEKKDEVQFQKQVIERLRARANAL
ncbi:MAG: tetratricopeptide repeat protein [Cyanobacteria bacterium]|nr:tetratricopeptide repeat protein [Cyanobacteriota bacterium]